MKKSIFAIAIALVVLAALATVVMADNGPHGSFSSTTDACASCHRAHSAQFGDNALLIQSPEEVCLECHDGRGAGTNVIKGVWNQGLGGDSATDALYGGSDSYYGTTYAQGSDGGSLLGGGFEFARMATSWTGANFYDNSTPTNPVSAATTSHHTFNGALSTVWGSGANNSTNVQYALECISCHSPHGNAGYINSTVAYPSTYIDVDANVPNNTAGPSYRLLRWQPAGSNGFTAPSASVNWSGGAFKSNGASTAVYGWLVPDNYRSNNHDEWYTLESKTDVGTQAVGFAKGDYAAGNVANVYQIVDGFTVKKDYTSAAVNIAYFCAQCHDRYFAKTALRNGTEDSAYCGAPYAGKTAGYITLNYYAPTAGGLHPVDPTRCVPVYDTAGVLNGWGDDGATGDSVYSFKHSSGDLRVSMDRSVAQSAGTSVGRSCIACHVSHGTTATMTTFAAGASLVGEGSVLLRLDNRSMCLRCHASTVGFVVTPNAAATSTAVGATPPGTWATQTAQAYATSIGAVPSATANATLTAIKLPTNTATQWVAATNTQAAANKTATAAVNQTATAAVNQTATAVAAQATSVCATAIAGSLPCP
jgi:predicted CXXCH cytochrome family protein